MLRASAGPLRSAGSAARPQIIARSQANALRQGAGSAQGIAGARNLFTRAQPQLFPRTRSFLGATVFVVGGTLFAIYYLDTRSAIHRWVVMPIMHATMDPETAHKAAVAILATGLAPRDRLPDDEVLATEVSDYAVFGPFSPRR